MHNVCQLFWNIVGVEKHLLLHEKKKKVHFSDMREIYWKVSIIHARNWSEAQLHCSAGDNWFYEVDLSRINTKILSVSTQFIIFSLVNKLGKIKATIKRHLKTRSQGVMGHIISTPPIIWSRHPSQPCLTLGSPSIYLCINSCAEIFLAFWYQ